MKQGWILYEEEKYKISVHYCNLYIEAFQKLNCKIGIILYEKLSCLIIDNKPKFIYNGVEISPPDFVINRTSNFLLAQTLEQLGLKVFNNSEVSRICNDKRLTYSLVAKSGIPIMNTALYFNRSTIDIPYPLITKDSFGSGGASVKLCNSIDQLSCQYTCNNLLAQQVCNDVGKDVRVYVVGKKVVCAILRQSDKDFRSNFSLGGNCSLFTLNSKQQQYVDTIANTLDFSFVGIDFLYCNGEFIFNEIEDCVGARMVYKITDINIVEIYAQYIFSCI